MGAGPSAEERRQEQAQLDELVTYVRQLPAVGNSRLCTSGSAAEAEAIFPSTTACPPASQSWPRAPDQLAACGTSESANPTDNVPLGLLPVAPVPSAATRPARSSAPIPIVRLSEWSSRDIDLVSRDLDGVRGFSHAACSKDPSDWASNASCSVEESSAGGGHLPIAAIDAGSRLSHHDLLPRRPPLSAAQAHASEGYDAPNPSQKTTGGGRSRRSGASAWGFSHSLPLGSALRRTRPPPPAPRCRPSPAPFSMPPKLELPPASPATTSLSSSPLSSTGVSLISSTPPESRFVQVGFHVVGGDHGHGAGPASWIDREVSSASHRFGSRARSR